ncbi:hypothetical protein GGTG_11993 [Gaeumannomyces tritici R3-111a-1]|uniref:Uncharacterized protein n=1 Tax=Gaeumannomyces tritici (strain R3-111a-1) TaxID=644352 RepID=J3PER2_GAET3|nr:hypothetical protein GGTG_11993 [Gaeumannomyces tritici R3-111a-1]EJT70970.1 hypothetical protein GGTG_11993 [Gaeumannomyces tritici R3-111a-1]
MVSFFGLGKKKKAEPAKAAPAPAQKKKVDQNTFGEGQYFGNNVKSKPALSPSMREFPSQFPSRPGTSSSMRNSPYAMQTHNFAATSMRDLSNMPGTSWTIEAPGTGLKSSASDVNLGMRWANSSSTSLATPSVGLRPGTAAGRPTTSAGDRKNKPWVNPLDVHFNRAVPAGPKSPLGNFELQVDVDGTGSLMGDDDIESTTSRAGAVASALSSPIATNFTVKPPTGMGLPLSPLGPPSSPPTGSLPSPPRSVNGVKDKSVTGHKLHPQHKGFGPAALPSPALSQRGGSQDSAPMANNDNDTDADSHDHHDNHDNHTLGGESEPWDESDALEFTKPVIRDVAAKRDTLTISGPRRQSLSMKIEELEKSLVSAQQESEQKNKAAAAAAVTIRPQGDDARMRSGSTAAPLMRNNGMNWQAAVWGVSVGAGPSLSPMHPDDRRPSPGFADNRGPRSQSPMRHGALTNGVPSGGPESRSMPLRDYEGRAQSPQMRNDQRHILPFAGPGSRAQSPMGRLPAHGPRAESPMDRVGAESPVDRPPPRPYAQDPPPRSPMRVAGPTASPMGTGPLPVFPKRGNGPNSSNPNGYWGPKDKSLAGMSATVEVNTYRSESPPVMDLSRQQSAQSSTGRSSPLLNTPGPVVRGPSTPRRPGPEEYGVFSSNSDRGMNRGPPRAAVGAKRADGASPASSRRAPSDEAESMQALHPPPRPQQQQLRPGHGQEQPWGSNSEGGAWRNDFAAPLASPLFPKDNVFGSGGVSAPATPAPMMDNPNWPLPAPTLTVQAPPQRPRTAGGPGHEGGHDGDNNALGIGLASTASVRKPQRHHVPPPLNLFSAQQYADEIPAGPFTPSPTVPPLTPTRSLTTPMAACDDPRPKTAGAGSGTIGMARGLSLRYERERQGFKEGNTAWGGQSQRTPLPEMPASHRRPDHGLEAPTGIADRFGNRFI